MRIGKKLNLLIVAVIAVIFIAIGVFAINYVPAVKMKTEKESLFVLDSAISELRADINKLTATSFDSQVEIIQEKSEQLHQKFLELDTFSYLKADPEIAEALQIISRLYSLYESNYERLMKITSDLVPNLNEVFLSDAVKIDNVLGSVMLDRYGNKKLITEMVYDLKSIISILDSNLTSTHMVVLEQYEIINSLISARERRSYIFGLMIVLVMSGAVLIMAIIVAARISSNIQKAGKGIQSMSAGDISQSFNIYSKDEISELGNNLNILTDSLKQVFKSMKNSSNKGVELKEELIASANQTSAAAAEIASNSRAISNQFIKLTERVAGASEANVSMKKSILSLEEFVQEQTAMVEESTSSVTEMISSINNVAEITAKKQQATGELVKTAEEGGKKLSATIGVINEINNSLDQIRGTATIIQQIASQTNLLAMNAAIEAAHAGEAGRGFAVVADEIRKLAEASSLNSKQISGVLKEIVSRIESASASGHETEAAFVEIDKEVESVAQSFDEISSSMDELNIGGRQILEAMTGLQDVSQQVNQGSDKMAVSSDEVTEAIEVVSRITAEVSNSADEITTGISEVSSAMTVVTELSNSLGDITDRLEKESARFQTETEVNVSDVTISEENVAPVEIETISEGK